MQSQIQYFKCDDVVEVKFEEPMWTTTFLFTVKFKFFQFKMQFQKKIQSPRRFVSLTVKESSMKPRKKNKFKLNVWHIKRVLNDLFMLLALL